VFWSVRASHVKADGTIYIRADGSIDPVTANITSADNVIYTFTDNIFDSIVIQRSNITVDGAGYTLQGSGSEDGFKLQQKNNVTIRDTTIRNFSRGVYLSESSNNTIFGNTFTDNSLGLSIDRSDNNTIQGNTITNGSSGIRIDFAYYNTIADNLITGLYGWSAVYTEACYYGRFLRNNITTNSWGGFILEFASSHNFLRNNTIAGSKRNFGVDLSPNVIQDIDTSNTVDGKPIYYLVNRRDEHVPSDAGYVALVNCTNMVVEGLDLRNNSEGVLLHSTQNSTIRNNNITKNVYPVLIGFSLNNTIHDNNIINNDRGIRQTYFSSNNTFSQNIFKNNGYGIRFNCNSPNNCIYHNSFVNSHVLGCGETNIWDDGYPSGDNYWSDYDGTDYYSGPYQNETGSDGIGDTPYVYPAAVKDNYPLIKPDLEDIEVTAVNPSRTSVGQGYTVQVNVTVTNLGGSAQSFNLTAQVNVTIIGSTMNMTLPMGGSTTTIFTWNTTGFQMGNYTIRAEVSQIPGELDLSDNILIVQEEVCVTIPGDVDADFDVDIYDIVQIASAYGTSKPDPNYDPISDIDGDGDIDIFDIVAACSHYGESW